MNLYFSYFSWHLSKSMYVCMYTYIHIPDITAEINHICVFNIHHERRCSLILPKLHTSCPSDAPWPWNFSDVSKGQKKHQRIWRCYKPRKIGWNDSHVQNDVWKWRSNIFLKIFTCLLFMGVWRICHWLFLEISFSHSPTSVEKNSTTQRVRCFVRFQGLVSPRIDGIDGSMKVCDVIFLMASQPTPSPKVPPPPQK